MSKISQLVSALAGDAYEEAKAIYDDILSSGTEREKQNAKYIMKTLMPERLETVILLTGQTVKAIVQETGFFYNNYLAKYDNHKLVWKGNCWMEY